VVDRSVDERAVSSRAFPEIGMRWRRAQLESLFIAKGRGVARPELTDDETWGRVRVSGAPEHKIRDFAVQQIGTHC